MMQFERDIANLFERDIANLFDIANLGSELGPTPACSNLLNDHIYYIIYIE